MKRTAPSRLPRRAESAGYVLLSVASALVVIAAISLMLNRNAGMTGELVTASDARAQLQLAAESGLTLTRRRINSDSCAGYGGLTDYPFPPGSGVLINTTVTPNAGTPVDVSVKATTTSGSSHTIALSGEPVYKWPLSSVTIAPGAAAGKDAWIGDGSVEYANFGAASLLYISNNLVQDRSLLQFDLSAVPAAADIIGASLVLDINTIVGGSDISVTAHRMTVDWLEGSGNGTVTDDGVDWHEYTASDHWVSHGGDFAAAVAGTATLPDPPAVYDDLVLEITPLVRGWAAGRYPNYGLLLQGSAPLTQLRLYSSDHINPDRHPQLVVYWRCLCGAAC